MSIHTDITQRKQTEVKLRESEERFRGLLADSNQGISIRQGLKFVYVNQAYADLYGYGGPDEVYALDSVEKLWPADERARMTGMSKARDRGEPAPMHYEYEGLRKDGTRVWLENRVQKIIWNDAPAVFSANIDISDRKATEDQLRQAQKMEAVGQLTGGVAHDFNNLLAVIMGNTELLQDELGADNKSLKAVFGAADRGVSLIERLLAFSRLQPLEPKSVDPGTLIDEISELLRRTLGETIEVEIVSEPDLWHARVDASQLESAFLNLALNARDAMRQGGTMRIESGNVTLDETYAAAHMDVIPGDYVLIAVSDNGTGMSPAVQTRALEPFFTTKDVGEGTGLGLPMVYGFAKQSGGDLVITSEEGQGTTVKLYLPRANVSREQAAELGNTTTWPGGGNETVLVIEDEPDVLALAEALITTLGYRVLTAKDGPDGMAILEEEPEIDLLLSDVVLPGGMSGPDFAIEAKRHISGLKVLFMSGYAEGMVRDQTRLPKGADLLHKPFRRRDLALRIRAALDR